MWSLPTTPSSWIWILGGYWMIWFDNRFNRFNIRGFYWFLLFPFRFKPRRRSIWPKVAMRCAPSWTTSPAPTSWRRWAPWASGWSRCAARASIVWIWKRRNAVGSPWRGCPPIATRAPVLMFLSYLSYLALSYIYTSFDFQDETHQFLHLLFLYPWLVLAPGLALASVGQPRSLCGERACCGTLVLFDTSQQLLVSEPLGLDLSIVKLCEVVRNRNITRSYRNARMGNFGLNGAMIGILSAETTQKMVTRLQWHWGRTLHGKRVGIIGTGGFADKHRSNIKWSFDSFDWTLGGYWWVLWPESRLDWIDHSQNHEETWQRWFCQVSNFDLWERLRKKICWVANSSNHLLFLISTCYRGILCFQEGFRMRRGGLRRLRSLTAFTELRRLIPTLPRLQNWWQLKYLKWSVLGSHFIRFLHLAQSSDLQGESKN